MGMYNDELLGISDGTCTQPENNNTNEENKISISSSESPETISVKKFCYDVNNNRINFN